MSNEYATLVLPNGIIIQFRRRDEDHPRFKVCSNATMGWAKRYGEFKDKYPDIDLDDCDANDLGVWILFLWKGAAVVGTWTLPSS